MKKIKFSEFSEQEQIKITEQIENRNWCGDESFFDTWNDPDCVYTVKDDGEVYIGWDYVASLN